MIPVVLRLRDHWVWDSWVADDGGAFHLLFLQAPRALGDVERRHAAARIGHATSADLVEWSYRGEALGPAPGAWDDGAIWTGSVARGGDGVWRLFYTAVSTRGPIAYDQRIGLAESADLMSWRRVGRAPLLEADPRWYRTVDGTVSETWRDPFVFRDPGGDGWHMLITARHPAAARRHEGILGHARSADLRRWEIQPPLSDPAGFGELEVPQVRLVDGRPLLMFTCAPREQSTQARAGGEFCTWSVTADALTGPWDIAAARPFRVEPTLYAAPLVQTRDGGWVLLGFRNTASPALEIIDPIPVVRDGDELRRRP